MSRRQGRAWTKPLERSGPATSFGAAQMGGGNPPEPGCVLFATEAGPTVGLGHLQRCLNLARVLRNLGEQVLFLVLGDSRSLRRVEELGIEAVGLPPNLDSDDAAPIMLRRACDLAIARGCRGVVVDSYSTTESGLALLVDQHLLVVAIDDLAAHPFPCQLVVNGGPHALQLAYRSSTAQTDFLLGPAYALLRPELASTPLRSHPPRVRRVLVTLGGGEFGSLLDEVLVALRDEDPSLDLRIIVGPLAGVRPSRHTPSAEVLIDPPHLLEVMRAADLAVASAGQTMYELAAAGTPTVAVITASNQRQGAEAMAREGIVLLAGAADEVGVAGRIRQAIRLLRDDPARRAQMARAGQTLLDGRGAIRVAARLCQRLRSSGTDSSS